MKIGGINLNIEEFKDIKIAYMRRVGKYGLENKQLMETFKAYLKNKNLFNEETTILGIALDNRKRKIASTLTFLGGCFAATNI